MTATPQRDPMQWYVIDVPSGRSIHGPIGFPDRETAAKVMRDDRIRGYRDLTVIRGTVKRDKRGNYC